MQAFVDAFPKPHQPVTALMADTQVRRLRKVMDELLAVAHTTRQHKVGTPFYYPLYMLCRGSGFILEIIP